MLRRSLVTSATVVLLLLGMGFATTQASIAAAASSITTGSASSYATPPSRTPVLAPWSNPNALVRFTGNQVILSLDGTTRVVAHDNSKRLDPVFAQLATVSPDSHWLLYVTAQNEGWQDAAFIRVNLTTLQRQVVATIPAHFWPQLRWSPDSQQIAYPLFNPHTGRPEIYIMDATGAHNRRVIASPTLTVASLTGMAQATFGWQSDGQALIYYNNALAPRIAYKVSVATATPVGQQAVTPAAITDPTIASTPCNAPIYTQTDSQWANDIMQTAGQTIYNDGCTLTSATMLADYYGGTQTDPGTMDGCIGNGADPFTWGDLQGCSQNTSWFQQDGFSWSTLNSELNAGHPVILGVNWTAYGGTCAQPNKTHWVLVVAGDNSNNPANYLINDPEYSTRQTLTSIASNAQLCWISIYHPVSGTWPSCVTGDTGDTTTNTDDVYAVGGDGSLYQYHWYSGSGWSINDLGHPTGVSLMGTPSASTVTQSGGLVQDVYVVGSDGNLYEYWFQNGAWNNGPLAPPSGVAFINSPSSFSYTDSVVHHSVFVLGNNGHLYNYAWAQNPWTLTDVSSTTGQSASLVNSPSAQTFIQSGVQTQDVYIAGADGNLYEFWYSGSWHTGNVSGAAPLPSGVDVLNSPSYFTFSYPGSSTLNHSVMVVGSNGRLYDFAWAQSPWTVTDVTAATSTTGVGFINSPSGDYLVQSGAGVQDFYALGNDNHLHEFWYTSGSWHTGDVSSEASATNVTIIGSPSAFSNFLPSAPTTVRHSTFVVTNDGHLREFVWVQNTTPWELLDHGAPSTTTLANSPNAHSYTS